MCSFSKEVNWVPRCYLYISLWMIPKSEIWASDRAPHLTVTLSWRCFCKPSASISENHALCVHERRNNWTFETEYWFFSGLSIIDIPFHLNKAIFFSIAEENKIIATGQIFLPPCILVTQKRSSVFNFPVTMLIPAFVTLPDNIYVFGI